MQCYAEGCGREAARLVQVMGASGYRVPLCMEHAGLELQSVGGEWAEPWAIPIQGMPGMTEIGEDKIVGYMRMAIDEDRMHSRHPGKVGQAIRLLARRLGIDERKLVV